MLNSFKLVEEKFSEEYKERWWTYLLNFELIFNKKIINYVTITDYTWTKKGRERITNELILGILKAEINGKRFFPTDYPGPRKPFRRDGIPYQNKKYRLVFWFKDGTTNHLWIRNCHQQD